MVVSKISEVIVKTKQRSDSKNKTTQLTDEVVDY